MYKIKSIHVPRNNTVLQRQPGHVPTSDKKVDISEQVKQFLKVYYVFSILVYKNNTILGSMLAYSL